MVKLKYSNLLEFADGQFGANPHGIFGKMGGYDARHTVNAKKYEEVRKNLFRGAMIDENRPGLGLKSQLWSVGDVLDFYGREWTLDGHGQKTLTTSDSGFINTIYGAFVFLAQNYMSPLYGALPKVKYTHSGWRVKSARATTAATGGIAEDGALPVDIEPTVLEISTTYKQIVHIYAVTEKLRFLSDHDDGIDNLLQWMIADLAMEHTLVKDEMLNTDNGTLAGYNLESIDRICSRYEEINGCTDGGGAAYSANDCDIYGLDRDANGNDYAEAYVDENNGTDRSFTISMMDTAIQNILTNIGAKPNLIMTGPTTYYRIGQLLQPRQRFGELSFGNPKADYGWIQPGVAGITDPFTDAGGVEGAFRVLTYDGIPILVDQNCDEDTIPRVYFLNTNYLGIRVAFPQRIFQAGIGMGQPFLTNFMGDKVMIASCEEPVCTCFPAQGKIRDLKL